jgi:hypothetical protein
MLKDGQPLCILVECYAGYRGKETPRRFRLGNRVIEVAEVVDRWLAPDHRYFKVQTAEGEMYILRNDNRSVGIDTVRGTQGFPTGNLTGSCKLQLFQRNACTPSADIGNNAQLERRDSIELDEVILDLVGACRRTEVVLLAYDLPVRRPAVG